MPEFVRIRDQHGNRYTVLEREAANDAFEVIDEPAVDHNGSPLPIQYPTPAPDEPTVTPPSGGFLSNLFRHPEGRPAIDQEES